MVVASGTSSRHVKAIAAQVIKHRRPEPPPAATALRETCGAALAELKANNVVESDVHGKTSVCDFMVVASGTSSRHVKAIADEVVRQAKKLDCQPLGVEGEREAEWVLVDLGDVVVQDRKSTRLNSSHQ